MSILKDPGNQVEEIKVPEKQFCECSKLTDMPCVAHTNISREAIGKFLVALPHGLFEVWLCEFCNFEFDIRIS